ncbi:hypothetical protein PV04_03519 [Phialophora macrospora]|uniref:Uncharacterized protein n=1 Tax=Phialophora macrospora TaxID=1851006 RepID=A0A0D2FSE7_9EURO|nr:hypothetical protein PV04_03519 [Phialophora macrospora]
MIKAMHKLRSPFSSRNSQPTFFFRLTGCRRSSQVELAQSKSQATSKAGGEGELLLLDDAVNLRRVTSRELCIFPLSKSIQSKFQVVRQYFEQLPVYEAGRCISLCRIPPRSQGVLFLLYTVWSSTWPKFRALLSPIP